MEKKFNFILSYVFGEGVRIKILEVLLKESLQNEIKWLNLSEIAEIARISTSSSKRIVDDLIKEKLVDLKTIQTHAKNPEKEIRLNLDNKIVKELIFFYRKIQGFL